MSSETEISETSSDTGIMQRKENIQALYGIVDDISSGQGLALDGIETVFEKQLKKPYVTADLRDGKYLDDNGSLLVKMMSMNKPNEPGINDAMKKLVNILSDTVPKTIVQISSGNKSQTKKVTPLHIAILNRDVELLKKFLKHVKKLGTSENELCCKALALDKTVLMAETPLGVATLCLHQENETEKKKARKVFKLVLKYLGVDKLQTNSKGDNIVHCLIKYSHMNPNRMAPQHVIEILTFLLEKTEPVDGKEVKIRLELGLPQTLLAKKNKENLTPLQVAAKRQQFEIFEFLMKQEVYRTKESMDEELFDVTEIETLPEEDDHQTDVHEKIQKESHESILQYLAYQDTINAFRFTDFFPVKVTIRTKWKRYRGPFWIWFLFHFTFMIVLSVAAVYRSKLEDTTPGAKVRYMYPMLKDAFVTTVAAIGVVVGSLYIIQEVSRLWRRRFQYQVSGNVFKRIHKQLSSPYSNLFFRIFFVIFAISLISDFIAAAATSSSSNSSYENYGLMIAIVTGWYLVLFFVQTIKTFSFFTVLIQNVIGDMLKFAVVMSILLLAFSVVMHMIMQGADAADDRFLYFFKSVITMFTIMIGLGDSDIIFSARQPVLAFIVFVIFVLLTTILLLNALIALMSNTCTGLMSNYGSVKANVIHCRLQKLSVILFLEGFLPSRLCLRVGEPETNRLHHTNHETRRIWRQSYVHGHEESTAEKMADILTTQHTELIPRILEYVQKRRRKTRVKPEQKKQAQQLYEQQQTFESATQTGPENHQIVYVQYNET